MKSALRTIACLSSLVAILVAGQASGQMQGQQRMSAYPAQRPVATTPYRLPPVGNAATGYRPAANMTAQWPAPTMQRMKRPVARMAQAYGPAAPYIGAAPTTSPYAPQVAAPAVQAQMPVAQPFPQTPSVQPHTQLPSVPFPQMPPAQTQATMPVAQPPIQVAAPAVAMPAVAAHAPIAPTQHAVIDGGAGCAPGGGYDPGFVGGGPVMDGGFVGGDMGYGYGGDMGYGGDAGCSDGSCGVPAGPVMVPNVSAGPTWFGGFYGLIMNRDDGNEIHFLTEPSVADNLYLSSRDAEMEVSGGYEVRLGRIFNGGSWGIEFVYWELFPDEQIASVQANQVNAAQLYATTDYRDVNLNFSDGSRDSIANTFTESGALVAARVRRDFTFQNIELNLLSGPLYGGGGLRAGQATPFGRGYADSGYGSGCGPCDGLYNNSCGTGGCGPRLQIGWLAGVRYFKFDESLGLDYDIADNIYNLADDSEFSHDVRVENDLVGVQLGLNLNYALTSCFSLDGGTKFGVYGNHISQTQSIRNSTGFGYINGPSGDLDYNLNGDDEDIAFLGELRFGGAYRLGCNWRLSGGYRAVALSGVGLATNQLAYGRSHTDLGKVGDIDRNGHLIVHGAYAGVEFCW